MHRYVKERFQRFDRLDVLRERVSVRKSGKAVFQLHYTTGGDFTQAVSGVCAEEFQCVGIIGSVNRRRFLLQTLDPLGIRFPFPSVSLDYGFDGTAAYVPAGCCT